ncbi:AHH domain-containing protein [Endozoicomonas numazuensis]|uniref:AHH domain-containing protein n=1 Tax=Endozoicomonas numazuensis TaxID=1137799 RepID=UPI00068BFC3E|nr:AHH domain-containing protein [Endozoicomonas numazuensis]
MAVPVNEKRYYQKDRVEHSIDRFASTKNPTPADLIAVSVTAQVELGIDRYRIGADEMTRKELRNEQHESSRLAGHLEDTGDSKPHPKCHAHAIVSGAHKDAAPMRAVLAHLKMRIDDSYNGCWLPENTSALTYMPKRLKQAVPHSRIHRFNYYFWLGTLINTSKTKSQDDLKYTLKTIELRLQAGSQPTYVMLRKGEGLPE